LGAMVTTPVWAEQPLTVVYPPAKHETTAEKIFLIGTASPDGEVLINGQEISRSLAGHFAPSFPLQLGENHFIVRSGSQSVEIQVTRRSTAPAVLTEFGIDEASLQPATDIARLPGEPICFRASAYPEATVVVKLGGQSVPLKPQTSVVALPPNSAVLTQQNQPLSQGVAGQFKGCTSLMKPGIVEQPSFEAIGKDEKLRAMAPGRVEILSPEALDVVVVTAAAGVARTGPSTTYSRLTPLPQGTHAMVTGREGEWLRLGYGGWIRARETQILPNAVLPQTTIRSIRSRRVGRWTEVVFPLEVPVPVSVQQRDRNLTLTLYNTTAQTDTIYVANDAVIDRLDWQQTMPNQVEYRFKLKSKQQWGYRLKYEGTSLILSLRHPPELTRHASPALSQTLTGISILLDPGHGGDELGARGPTGYPEKAVNLAVSKLLQVELQQRGATVYMTREDDRFVSLGERMAAIDQLEPTIALSIHYNALPDNGDAIDTQGVGAFWYNAQAHSLATFLHDYLVQDLERSAYGVYWNNLALTRPTTAPSVLLELGFMINPTEFEWIVDPVEQKKLASAIADGIVEWLRKVR